MILAWPEIHAAMEAGDIRFDPVLEEKQCGEASVDLRLGTQFTRVKSVSSLKISLHDGLGGISGIWETMELTPRNAFGQLNSFCLEPGEFILAMTHESIAIPRNMIALVEGRSTYARLGLSMHQTAPWVQPGWSGRLVLEIKNHGPVRIELTPLLDRPCQLTFLQLSSGLPAAMAYGGRREESYAGQTHPLDRSKKDEGESR